MKRYIFGIVAIMALLCLILVSCGETKATTPTTTSNTTSGSSNSNDVSPDWMQIYDNYMQQLEPDRSPLPSLDDIKMISPGMLFTQVYEVAGVAQRTETRNMPSQPSTSMTIPMLFYVYDTEDGVSVMLSFVSYENQNDLITEPCVKYVIYIYPDGHKEYLTTKDTTEPATTSQVPGTTTVPPTTETTGQYSIYLYDMTSDFNIDEIKDEFDFFDEADFSSQNIPQSYTLTINGEEHIGVYRATEAACWCATDMELGYPINHYVTEEGVNFSLDFDGRLVYFSDLHDSYRENEVKLTDDEAISVAKEFVSQYTDASQYEVRTLPYEPYEFEKTVMFFKLLPKESGLYLADYIQVTVASYSSNRIVSFRSSYMGKMSNEDNYGWDVDEIKKCVDSKATPLLEKVTNALVQQYGEKYRSLETAVASNEYLIIPTKDGQTAVVFQMNLTYCFLDETNTEKNETEAWFFVATKRN